MTILFLERKFLPVFSIFSKSAQTDAEWIICNLMFALKGTHQPRHTDAGGLSCGADLLLIVFLPTSVSKTFKQMFHTTRLISVWWCQMGDGAVLHLHMSFLFFIFPLCSGWGLVGWLKILWFSRDSEIYLSNLGVCVCVSLVNGCSCTCMIKIELKLERECISKNRKEKNALLKGWSQWWITYSIRGQKWPYKTKKTFFFN